MRVLFVFSSSDLFSSFLNIRLWICLYATIEECKELILKSSLFGVDGETRSDKNIRNEGRESILDKAPSESPHSAGHEVSQDRNQYMYIMTIVLYY